jgi:basic membrane protein A
VHSSLRRNRARSSRFGRFVGATGVAVALTAGLVACGSGDGESSADDFSACLMTSETGIADRSFNQQAWAALTQLKDESGIEIRNLAKSGSTDYPVIGEQFVQQGCSMIIGVGFNTTSTVEDLAPKNPDIKFVVIDDTLDNKVENATSLTYATDQGAFLGGYLAAGMSKTKVVGVYGNQPIPPVQLYMTGFVDGVNHYNEVKGESVKVLGWDPVAKTGQFVGSYTDVNKGKLITESEMQQGADVIFPVAGPIAQGTAVAVSDAGGAAASKYMLWVDSDGCIANAEYCGIMLSTVEKGIQKSLYDVTKATVDDQFPSGSYVGDVANGGVGLAPYHELDGAIPAELKTEIETLTKGISDGSVSVG